MPRAGLDPTIVVRRAAELIDADGLEALTLARLATELGVATPSLYKHVGGLDDLLARVAVGATAALASEIDAASRGLADLDALRAIARAYRSFVHQHPGTYPLTQRSRNDPAWREAAAEAVISVATALSGYGITPADVDQIRWVRSALHGFVDLERDGGFGLPDSVETSFDFLIDAVDSTLRRSG